MFVRLAIRNVKKNYNRSLLAICGMIVAAAVLTGGGAFSQLYPERGYFGYRQGAGGDIVVFPGLLAFDERHANDATVHWRLNSAGNGLASLSTYDADQRALLQPAGQPPEPFRLDALPPALTRPELEIYPYLGLPVIVRYRDARSGAMCERVAILRGRMTSVDLDRYDLGKSVTSGRYLAAGDAGAYVAVVNIPPMNEMMQRTAAAALTGLGAGQQLTIVVPAVRGLVGGELLYDYDQTKEYGFQSVGAVAIPTDIEQLRDENGKLKLNALNKPTPIQMYWDQPEIYVPSETWERIYSEVSGGLPVYTGRIGVVVRDAATMKSVTTGLSTALPGTAIAVADLAAAEQANKSQIVMPRDLTGLLNILAYLISGLLMAANMHVLVSQRQAEIGVMKAIGVGARDIFTLTMLETAGFSVIGGLIGFLAVSGLLWLVGYWTAGVAVGAALGLTLKSLLRVLGFTLGTALIFGFAPAWRATRATTVATLRAE